MGTTFRVSRTFISGVGFRPGNGQSRRASIRDDGVEIAFGSLATNLALGDTDAFEDVLIINTNALDDPSFTNPIRASVPTSGSSNGHSTFPMFHPNAGFIAFESTASNLVPNDTNGLKDVFVRDRFLNLTYRYSVTSTNAQAVGGASGVPDLSGSQTQILAPNVDFVVVYESQATNLDPMDANGVQDIFETRSRHFIRGDVNSSNGIGFIDQLDVNDLCAFVGGGPVPPCVETADADDSGVVNINDCVYLSNFVSMSGPPPLHPFPVCGMDRTIDALGCAAYDCP